MSSFKIIESLLISDYRREGYYFVVEVFTFLSIFSVKAEGISLLADFSCKYFQLFLTSITPKCDGRKKSELNYSVR